MSQNRTIAATAHSATACRPDKALAGQIYLPSDKSISHRAIILAAMATGTSQIDGLLESADILATIAAMRALGATIKKTGDKSPNNRSPNNEWIVQGVGPAGLQNPTAPLDFGNSGTGARLVMGVVAGGGIAAQFVGDKSLSARPMARITAPLAQMGAQIEVLSQNPKKPNAPLNRNNIDATHLPLKLRGAPIPLPIEYTPPVASAQIKSAILLAGLGAHGKTRIREAQPTRDHSENMLALFAADIYRHQQGDHHIVELNGPSRLRGCDIDIPGDPSSAAFPLVAALLVPQSDIILQDIMLNPHRDGLIKILRDMGADIRILNIRHASGEKRGDIGVRASVLHGVDVPADKTAAMIDEYPILAVAAAAAHGTTHMHGLGELRVKESDRLAAIADGLAENGVQVQQGADFLRITGTGGAIAGGGMVATQHDHRIAMAFLVLGLAAQKPVHIDDTQMIATSFPNFFQLMAQIGARFEQ